jgi:RimJ/RimL family protein N-acetyltransferase
MTQHPFITGKIVDFYAIVEEDFTERLLGWRNDPEVAYYLFQGVLPSSPELLKEEYETLIKSNKDVVLAIVEKKKGTRIGLTGFYDIDWIARHGEHRLIIGEKEFWKKGYGNEVVEVMTEYGFGRLNLNKVRAGANAENAASLKCYQRLGYVQEGVFRQHQYRHGKYYDTVMFSIFREEFIASMKNMYGDSWCLERE